MKAILVVLSVTFLYLKLVLTFYTPVYNKLLKLVSPFGSCSAFLIKGKQNTYVMTAGHCVDLYDRYGDYNFMFDGGDYFKSRLIKEDKNADLALFENNSFVNGLEIAENEDHINLRTFSFINSPASFFTSIEKYERAPVPLTWCDLNMKKFKVYRGICYLDTYLNKISDSISPGGSGGPTVNSKFEVVGVSSASNGINGWIVPLHDIRNFVSEVENEK